MALKHKLEKLDEVPEAIRSFYVESNGAFFLQVEGLVPKERLDEFRNNNITLTNELNGLKDRFKDVDPVKYRELLAGQGKTPEEIENAVKARVKQLAEEHQTTVADLTGKLTAAQAQLSTVLVDGSLRAEATKAGILATAIDDVILRGRGVFKADNGALLATDPKGEKLYDKDGTTPLSVATWVKDLKKSAPHLFEGMRGGGAGGNNGGQGGQGFDMSKATATQKISAGLAMQQQNGG